MLIGNIHFKGRQFAGNAITAARNGVSLVNELGVNYVELGNQPGLRDGELLHNTEIGLNTSLLSILMDNDNKLVQFDIDGMRFLGDSNFPLFQGIRLEFIETNSGNTSFIQRQIEGLDIGMSGIPGVSRLRFLDDGRIVYQGLTNPGLVSDVNADFTINGPLAARKIIRVITSNTTVSGNGNVIYTNEGAAGAVALDAGAFPLGAEITLIVRTAQTFSISGTAQTFRIFNSVTASGGSVSSNQVGSTITFCMPDANLAEWVCTSMMGSWTI